MTNTKVEGLDNPAFLTKDEQPGEFTASFKVAGLQSEDKVVVDKKDNVGHDNPQERRAIFRNVIIISIAFTFFFTSYNAMANLQSSINKTDGTVSLTTIYAALVVSSCCLPSLLIKVLKAKYTIAVCMFACSTYIAAQFYPTLGTLVPTAILLGLAAAPLWSAKCTYLTKVATKYAEMIGENSEVVITRYFGIFFLFFQSTQVWGNLISSTVLSTSLGELNKTEEELGQCGYNFCPDSSVSNSTDDGIPDWQRYTMASIYLGIALLSVVIVVLFVNPLSRFLGDQAGATTEESSPLQLLAAAFNHMRHPYQLLIIPITMWTGLEQGFFQSDYTAAYVSCGLGVHMVGYVMICYGVCDAICSISLSPLVKIVGRVPVIIVGAIINIGIIITLVYWAPHPDDTVIFFIISGLWGVVDAVWQTQINALYGVIFPGKSEAAFSNHRLWQSIGFVISFVCSTVTCISSTVIVVLVFIVLGIIGYLCVEVMERFDVLKKDSDGAAIPIDKLIRWNQQAAQPKNGV